MRLFLRLAWRNIARNRRRSLITLAAITFGLASIIIFFGFTDGFHAQWIENSVRLYAGHALVYAKGYDDDRNLNRNITDATVIEAAARRTGALESFTTRVHVHGLASTARTSTAVLIRGVEMEREKPVTGLDRRIIDGSYFTADDSGRQVLLGHMLAERLHAVIGDKVVLMVQAADGSIGAELFRVQGIFRVGAIDLDRYLAIVTLHDAQELAVIGSGVTDAVVILEAPDQVEPVVRELEASLGAGSYDVLPWYVLMPQTREMIDFSASFLYIILVIVLVMVALGILNTMLMSIMERIREFGIMMALGTRPAQVVSLVMLESLLLGLLGTLLGVVTGVVTNRLIALRGFDLSRWSGAMELVSSLNPVIYPQTDPHNVALAAVATFAVTVLVSVYPALKAARLKPVEAMHFV